VESATVKALRKGRGVVWFGIMKALSGACLVCVLAAVLTGCVGLSSSDSSPGFLTRIFVPSDTRAPKPGTDQVKARAAAVATWSIDQDPTVMSLTLKVKRDPRGTLPSLVNTLVKGRKDDFERIRALHDWVAENIAYDFSAFKGMSPMIVEPYQVITHGSSVCEGYSELFQLMCSLAGLECRVISGYGRGYGFDGFAEDARPFESNHAWNAVRVGDGWYLLDTTWDSGGVASNGVFTREYSTGYLFTPPDIFLCTHFPEEPRWQLAAQPLGFESFKSLPYLEGAFATLGFKAESPLTRCATVAADDELAFKAPAGLTLSLYLTPTGQSQSIQGSVAAERVGDTVHVRILFPAAGKYTASLFARARGDKTSGDYLGSLYYTATGGSDQRLPSMDPEAAEIGLSFDAENGYAYKVEGLASIRFACPRDITVKLEDASERQCANRVSLSGEGSTRVARVSFPAPGWYTLWFFAKNPENPTMSHSVASMQFLATQASAIEYPSIVDEAARATFSMGDGSGYLPRVGNETCFTFRYPGTVRASLSDATGKAVPNRIFCVNQGDAHTVSVSFPASGEYSVWLFSEPNAGSVTYSALASLHYVAAGASGRTFPTVYNGPANKSFSIVSPLDGGLKAGQMVDFDVAGPSGATVYVSCGGASVILAENEGHYRGSLRPSGTRADIFVRMPGETSANCLVGYLVQ